MAWRPPVAASCLTVQHKLGLHPFAVRVASLGEEILRSKKGRRERERRFIEGSKPICAAAFAAGMERAMIAVRDNPAAVRSIYAAMEQAAEDERETPSFAVLDARLRALRGD